VPRKPRDAAPGTIHHVTVRGNNRAGIFLDDADRMAFLRRLRLTAHRSAIVVHAYCLMDTHVHLVLQPESSDLGQRMQFLLGGYAHSFNRRHARTGHLFEGPFDSRLIENETYLLTAVIYVVLNPVRAGICAQPGDYRWSSYQTTVGKVTAPVVDISPLVLGLLTADLEHARRRFDAYATRQAELLVATAGSG
jgi:putative transposase